MTFDEFVREYNGKAVDYDGGYGVQCVDLIKLYADKVFNLKFGKFGDAHAYYDNFENIKTLRDNFDKIPNTPKFVPQKGDIIVWNKNRGGGCGHIAICNGIGTTGYFCSYDQNWNGKKAMQLVKHSYSNVYGVLRPKKQSKINGKLNLSYQVHIQNIGWQECMENGQVAGTEGQGLRIEAIKIFADIPIQYRVHIQDKGWSNYVPNGCLSGTVGEGKRIEAIEIISSRNTIKAQAHVENIGWQKEVQATHIKIGTEAKSLRLEALKLEFI